MSKRSPQNTKYWTDRITSLFELAPETSLVKERYRCLRLLLQEKYKPIMQSVSVDTIEMFLKDAIYLDRQVRLHTEGQEVEEKELLEQEYIVNNLI